MDLLLSLLLIPFAVPLALGFVTMCCCAGDCSYCSAGQQQFQVDIDGVLDNTCGNCLIYNGTHVADFAFSGDPSCGPSGEQPPGGCVWIADTGGDLTGCGTSCCTAVFVTLSNVGSPTFHRSTVQLRHTIDTSGSDCVSGTSQSTEGIFAYAHGAAEPDCSSFAALTHTYTGSTATFCDSSTANVTVTSL